MKNNDDFPNNLSDEMQARLEYLLAGNKPNYVRVEHEGKGHFGILTMEQYMENNEKRAAYLEQTAKQKAEDLKSIKMHSLARPVVGWSLYVAANLASVWFLVTN